MANSKSSKLEILGKSLKWLRENHRETLAETAGALEVDGKTLERFEDGIEVPSEDLLDLMVTHFKVGDEQAIRLRHLAGYEGDQQMPLMQMPVVLLSMDQRVVYTDGAHIEVNPEGVVVNFLQGNNPAIPVARVGMSHTQAEKVLLTLEQALLRLKYLAGPLALPPGTDKHKKQ